MKHTLFIFFALFIAGSTTGVMAQNNCANYVRYQSPTTPYKYSSLSKSASCTTGKNYKLVLPLNAGKSYRISFYASTVFNNRIEFKVTDKSTGQDIMYLPGDKTQMDNPAAYYNNCNSYSDALVSELDPATYRSLPYPYIEIEPAASTNIEVEINLLDPKKGGILRGCVGIFVQDRMVDSVDGFE